MTSTYILTEDLADGRILYKVSECRHEDYPELVSLNDKLTNVREQIQDVIKENRKKSQVPESLK